MQTVALVVITLVSILAGYIALMNLATCVRNQTTISTRLLFVTSAMLNVAVAVGVGASGIAYVTTFALVTVSLAYYLGQRYESKAFQSGLTHKRPHVLLTTRVALFSFSTVLFGMSGNPLLTSIPLMTWIVSAILSTELAISRERLRITAHRKGEPVTRSDAICAVNANQGRPVLGFTANAAKYPYP
ncbi:hypothetical protein R70006_06173 [Paraburkholderia domus]|nr:hypothetical protein R70006_06173 [Paraburkholderia domus]